MIHNIIICRTVCSNAIEGFSNVFIRYINRARASEFMDSIKIESPKIKIVSTE